MQTDWFIKINVTNGKQTISELNRISVINGNNKGPEFVTNTRIFEIEEVLNFSFSFVALINFDK
jgi:hypothetical protein